MNLQTPDLGVRAHEDRLAPPDRTPSHVVDATTLAAQNIYGFLNGDTRSRPFKLLRSQMLKLVGAGRTRIIGITSATPGVGKSFIAANLAAALSRIANVHVYLVDLDLHRPAIARRFGLSDGHGIHDYLSGSVTSLDQIARRVNDEQLVVLPGFSRDIATGELLSGENDDRLFAALRSLPENAVVLVDMPPIFADDDAVIISARIDGYVLVAEDGRTTAKQIRDTVRVMEPAPLIGTVLNRYRSQIFSDDYGYGAGYGYGAY
jgi:Mrp family chromosome partitioning ATPase